MNLKALIRQITPPIVLEAYSRLRHYQTWRPPLNPELLQLDNVPGFLAFEEGLLLYHLACEVPVAGRVVELGSYQGRSTVFLAAGTRDRADGSAAVIAVDHHKGSPEHQPGEECFNPLVACVDRTGIDTFPHLLSNIRSLGLEEWVEPWRCSTLAATGRFSGSIRLLFVDAAHDVNSVVAEIEAWEPFLVEGGILCFHDSGEEGPAIVAKHLRRCGYKQHALVGSLLALRRGPAGGTFPVPRAKRAR